MYHICVAVQWRRRKPQTFRATWDLTALLLLMYVIVSVPLAKIKTNQELMDVMFDQNFRCVNTQRKSADDEAKLLLPAVLDAAASQKLGCNLPNIVSFFMLYSYRRMKNDIQKYLLLL